MNGLTNRRGRAFLLAVAAAAMLGGCVVRVRAPVEPGAVVVAEEPPHERVEVVTASPGPEFIWIRGYWTWSGRGWVWAPGRWEQRRHGHDWVAGHWARRGRGWVWVPGHWRRL